MRILMTGATGMIGKELGKALVQKGHEIWALTRSREKALLELPYPAHIVEGDLTKGTCEELREIQFDVVISLAGENVAGRSWSEEQKKRIFDSRVKLNRHLQDSLKTPVSLFIGANAIGIYGDRDDEELSEDSQPGSDFLAKLCEQWEALTLSSPAKRKVSVRIGLVLARQGGLLARLLPPFQFGVGGPIGSGKQWMSWIHIEDLVQVFIAAVEDSSVAGPINAVAPEPLRNVEFSKQFGAAIGKPAVITTPIFALRLAFGELADTISGSQKVIAKKLKIQWLYPKLTQALENLFPPTERGEEIFYAEQYVAHPLAEVFFFFADARNLEEITPPFLNFQIETVSTPEIREGTEIVYRLKVHGVPLKWRSVIEDWRPQQRFVDRQVQGPYRLWHHTHDFAAFGGGTLISDRVRYQVPLGMLGKSVAGSFIKSDVEKIFAYRRKVLNARFPQPDRI